MPIPMNILLDLALGLILLSILYNSWRRGFVASFIRLAGTVASFLIASFLSRPLAERVYAIFLRERVEQYVSETLLAQGSPLLEALAGLDLGRLELAGGAASQAIAGFLSEQGLDFYSAQDAGQMGRDICSRITEMGSDPVIAITQVAIKPLVMTVLETAFFFLLLFITGIAVRMAAQLGMGVNHIPLVGGMNRLAGLLCGAAYALLVGYVISSALLLLAGLGRNQWELINSSVLQNTVLIRHILELRHYLH